MTTISLGFWGLFVVAIAVLVLVVVPQQLSHRSTMAVGYTNSLSLSTYMYSYFISHALYIRAYTRLHFQHGSVNFCISQEEQEDFEGKERWKEESVSTRNLKSHICSVYVYICICMHICMRCFGIWHELYVVFWACVALIRSRRRIGMISRRRRSSMSEILGKLLSPEPRGPR